MMDGRQIKAVRTGSCHSQRQDFIDVSAPLKVCNTEHTVSLLVILDVLTHLLALSEVHWQGTEKYKLPHELCTAMQAHVSMQSKQSC